MPTPFQAVVYVVMVGLISSFYFGQEYGEFAAWFSFVTLAPLPMAQWRWLLKQKDNVFDWLGYAGAAGVWLYVGWLVVQDLGGVVHPVSLAFGFAAGVVPAIGSYGLMAILAFAFERLPRLELRGPARRQRPYSVPEDGGRFTFDPSVYGQRAEPPRGHGQGPSATPPFGESRRERIEDRSRRDHERAGQGGSMSYRDALDWLGIAEGFTLEELKARFRELSKRMHPDCGGSNAQFRKLEEAYRALKKHAV